MQISLDCYQILGLPLQATPEQLEQAYQDRQQQQPHPHYSTATITARQELIDQAYRTLRNPLSRNQYDQAVLSYAQNLKSQPKSEEQPPGIQAEDTQFPGALLLLYELGAYNQALELGQQHLSRGTFDLRRPYTGSAFADTDILLTVALSYLELGREQWQQGHYEPAAYYLQGGLDILVSENQFNDIQSQLKTELFRLRPYRVLELVAHPELESSERQRGLMLLKDMLLDRQGIDGNRDDHSGLGIDDFLKFIQQLRAYLTTTEQQELFEAEAHRPSAVGTYLASYALMARGVSQRQPALIRRAKSMLKRLLPHQDVYLEIASAALLLGQTTEALQTLTLTQDTEALNFVKEYSAQAPDLLPGLYHYTDQWLAEEVYPSFRDLIGQPVGLEEYFADEQIQAYADALATESGPKEHRPVTVPPPDVFVPIANSVIAHPADTHLPEPVAAISTPPREIYPDFNWPGESRINESPSTPPPQEIPTTTTGFPSLSAPTLPFQGIDLPPSLTGPRPEIHLTRPDAESYAEPQSHPIPLNSAPRKTRTSREKRTSPKSSLKIAHPGRFALVCSGFLVAVMGLAWGGRHLWLNATNSDIIESPSNSTPPPLPTSPPPVPAPESPQVALSPSPTAEPTLSIPTPSPTTPPPNGSSSEILTTEMAQAQIQRWQDSKAKALGQTHNTEALATILAEPALSRWKSTAQTSQAENNHWQFSLQELEVDSLKPLGDDRFEVIARIREAANFYQNGQLQAGSSYEDNYRVRYVFVRQGNEWLIREMRVLS